MKKLINIMCSIGIVNRYTLGPMQRLYRLLFRSPSSVQLHVTTHCNLSCDYCYSNCDDEVSPIDWFQVLREARAMGIGHIDILGGEPLLDPKLKEYLELWIGRGRTLTIHTNGTLIDEKWATQFSSYGDDLKISIKFDNRSSFESMIGPDHYDRVLEALEICKKMDLYIEVHTFIHALNVEDIGEIIDAARDYRAFLTIERYMKQGHGADERYGISREEWNKALSKYHEYCLSFSKTSLTRGSVKGNGCSCYLDLLSINSNGHVLPCAFSSETQSVGNVLNSSLKEIWKVYRKRAHKEWMIIPKECRKCSLKNMCHGGCKTEIFNLHGDYNHRDPFCENGSRIPMGIYSPPSPKGRF